MTEFVHLHVHSQYSMLDGAMKVKNLVKLVGKQGMNTVALTDHGNMFGSITFYKAAKDANVKAILGSELEVVTGGHGHHLPLLAATEDGYKNLVQLVSRGYVDPDPTGTPGVPCVPLSALEGKTKGLVAMTGCMGGVLAQSILEQGPEAGAKTLGQLKELFEPGSLYVELQDHGLPEQPILKGILKDLAKRFDLPMVATNDVHYGLKEDAEAALYLSCIKNGRSYEEAKERHHGSNEMYLKTPAEMAAVFKDEPDAIKATLEIAEKCQLKLKLGNPMLPSFGVPEGMDEPTYFRKVAEEGLESRFEELEAKGIKVDRDVYRKRLAMEMDVICKMKFPGYFLIVWDFIRYGKENGVPVGPGRGSGAGSIVAYSMRITDLDPIPFNLLFERFLNPERVSMPDFDVDFCMDKRDRVIQYVQKKYGETSVGQIATFAELKAKSVIKDVARALSIPPFEAQQVANLIPNKTPAETYTISESLEIEPKLKARYETEPRIKELLSQGIKLEGLTRHAGKHAAGIVISEGPLWDHVPVFKDGKSDGYITQYYKDDVEQAGLVKFDFLGLKTLTVIDIAQRLIHGRPDQKDKPESERLDVNKIGLDDKPSYQLMATGETKGVFQLESSGMQQLFKDLHPDSFEDIVAAVALYRPGPLGTGMVKDFVDCKHGRKPIAKMHDKVDHILAPTYGVIVYQEQVMQIAQALAGYSLGGADLLRRAMGKKKPEEMAKQKGIFVDGAKSIGVLEEDADRIFGLLEFFAGYGFNKCLISSTKLTHAKTGEQTTVGELFTRRRPFVVHALDGEGKLRPRRVTDVVRNGRKRVFELRTAQGKRIVATGNHPFRTLLGWTNLEELRVGDRIAAPRSLSVPATKRWPKHEIIGLAGLLSEGNTCHPTCLYFFGNDRALVDDFARAAAAFPDSVARVYARKDSRRLEVCVSTGQDRRFHSGQVPWNKRDVDGSAVRVLEPTPTRCGMFAWARDLGILGKLAKEKSVPAPVFELHDDDLALFLGRLWAGDGFFANATQAVPFYATSSIALANDVQVLLLRLGIQSGVHTKAFRYRGTEVPGYTVHLVGESSREIFLARVAPHAVGRESAVALLRQAVGGASKDPTGGSRTSKDTIPASVRKLVDAARQRHGLSWRELESTSGISMREFLGAGSSAKGGFRRGTIAKLGEFLDDARLCEIASSDVFWDKIVSIEPAGIEETYDLTVDVDHNFVADGLIVHNSHSAAYALITYQTAYLKAHYPVELLCGIMTSDKDKVDKVVRTIADARAMGVTVLPPDVNQSDIDFKVVYTHPNGDRKIPRTARSAVARDRYGSQIRFGLGAVRGLGEAALEALLEARKEGGPFVDLFDFASRVDAKRVNKGVFEALVQCGAFDSTLASRGITRADAFASIEVAVERSRAASRDRERGQTNLFGLFDAAPKSSSTNGAPASSAAAGGYVITEPWDRKEMLVREQKALGFFVSGHPLERYIKGSGGLSKLEAVPIASLATANDWAVVNVVGTVEGYRERIFKDGGGKIAFLELEDLTGRVTCKVRGNQIDAYAPVLTSGDPVLVKGKVSFPFRESDGEGEEEGPREPTLFVNEAVRLSDSVKQDTKLVNIRLPAEKTTTVQLDRMADVLRRSSGNCPVTLVIATKEGAEAFLSLGKSFRVEVGDEILSGLEKIFGEQVAELR